MSVKKKIKGWVVLNSFGNIKKVGHSLYVFTSKKWARTYTFGSNEPIVACLIELPQQERKIK